jgi:hypothetical protein
MPDNADQRRDEKVFVLIITTLREPNFYNKLNMALALTKSLRASIAKKYNVTAFQNGIRKILKDQNFVRALLSRESIIAEDAIIYYGSEHRDCDYNYDTELEKVIVPLNLNITEFLGSIINELDVSRGLTLDSIPGA